ncbi:unnamed protein product [Fusarium graminearum]|nr:unnamed protein product [Fusarium graminearum]
MVPEQFVILNKNMSLTLLLFLIGILGFVFNRKNLILMLISIEIMLLSITFLILVSSVNIDDIIGQTYAIYIIVVAGAESAIGLAILVAFYRLASHYAPGSINRASTSNIQSLNRVSDLRKVNSYPFKVPGTFIRNYSTTRIALHKKDVALLNNIQSYFGGIGTVAVRGDRCYFILLSLTLTLIL